MRINHLFNMQRMLNQNIPSIGELYLKFTDALPFKHISIENFLDPNAAQGLVDQFPTFDPNRAKNEMGTTGGKATREDVRALGPAYEAIDNFFSSPPFLSYLSKLTGIPGLIYDPEYFGGGTHENVHGQELDVHVDFNYHRSTKLHRRLNVITYLNHEWDESWGGNIEIHSDPRNPARDQITQFAPLFNRCVIFETNEYSWHGFSKIQLPEDKRHLSRKSYTVYYYTKSRPANEIVPPHNTFYIQRPLAKDVQAGSTLTQEKYNEIRGLLSKRDTWLYFYQDLELKLNGEIMALRHQNSELQSLIKPKTLGYIAAQSNPEGYYPDGWLAPLFKGSIVALRDVRSVTLQLNIPESLPSGTILEILVNKIPQQPIPITPGSPLEIHTNTVLAKGTICEIELKSSASFSPKNIGLNSDDRNLFCILENIIAEH